ncbi:MAG: serine/threonine-protein kinase, partial [Acidobacteriota bacterium]
MSIGRVDYGTAVPLSSGGVGELYKAYDAKLGRHVALKFLRSDDPSQVRRLAREARTQANLPTHPNLCAIYGVGDYEGRPYMAMEYIEGEGLDAVGQSLSVDERVRAIAQIAEALSIVHAAGLVHRDIKPANIVLSRSGGAGDLRPVLVDFGTVWSADHRTMTRLGQFVGTPAYMAPEQVRGGRDALGPAVDVYGLGATLYALLTGRPPFGAASSIHLLHQVLNDDAPRLRAVWPEAPRALEAVFMRCLAKDPAMRYADAAALAADLQRYLAGESVLAPATRWNTRVAHRIGRWRRPLRMALSVMAVGLVLLGVSAYRAQQRLAAAQRYDALGADLEGALRAVYMSSYHDVRPAQQRVRARIVALEAALAAAPGPARAPMRGAIGRGWLALGAPARGLAHLRAAWAADHRTPVIAYAIGRALSGRYAAARAHASGLLDPASRRAHDAEAVRRYRAPARTFLARGRGASSTSPGFVEALLQLHDGNYDAARAQVRIARAELPWQHEVDALLGTIHRVEALDDFARGDPRASWPHLIAADRAYRRAQRSAASDPHIAASLCAQRRLMLRYAVVNAGLFAATSLPSVVAYRDAARIACHRAQRLAPTDADAVVDRARIEWQWAIHQQRLLNESNRPAVHRGRLWARHALRLDPHHAAALDLLSSLALLPARAYGASLDHREPRPWLDLAEVYCRRLAGFADQRGTVVNRLAAVFHGRGYAELTAGLDPHRTLQRAAAYAAASVRHAPERASHHYNLGMMHTALAEISLHFGRAIDEDLARANAAFRRGQRLNPDNYWGAFQIALGYGNGARQAFYRREDPTPWIEHAAQQMNRILARSPELAYLHELRARLLIEGARLRLERGDDPT